MAVHAQERTARAADEALELRPQFALADEIGEVPKLRLPAAGMPPDVAYQVVHDELMLDGNARLNLATFVTTWMEPAAEKLMAECFDKNMIDKDEYPRTAELERRCVEMLARLWHAPGGAPAVGCSTTGSSEAAMLGGLALLHRWRARGGTGRPNLVMGANVQVCWEKFCRFWDVEPRLVDVGPDTTCLTPERAAAACDAQTIGVVAVLGSTFDGVFEPVADIAEALDRLADERGIDVPMHVDGASGGFVAPFLDPDLEWDFRVERVQSINASGHKYGLVYPGVGWALWREAAALSEELIFRVSYLGGDMPTFALNFSRPGAQVVGQYFMLLRLGFEGFREVQQACRDTARWLAQAINGLGAFELVSDGGDLPVVAFRMAGDASGSVYDVSELLRARGWLVPAYPMPPKLEDVHVLRVVVRNGFGHDLGEMLVDDLRRSTERLARGPHAPDLGPRTAFHH
jgi:glutamate decarboxylase